MQHEVSPEQVARQAEQVSPEPSDTHRPALLQICPLEQVPQDPPQPSEPHWRPSQLGSQVTHGLSQESSRRTSSSSATVSGCPQPLSYMIMVDEYALEGVFKNVDLFRPPKNFENETINLKITSKSSYTGGDVDDKYLEGDTISFGITLSNDGSLKEEKSSTPGFEILAFIVSLGILLILFRKNYNH